MTDTLTEEVTMIAAGKAVTQLRFFHCEVTLIFYISMDPPKSDWAQATHRYSVFQANQVCFG